MTQSERPDSITVKLVPIEAIKLDPLQPRSTAASDLSELAGSIAAIGIVEPLLVRPDGDEYTIVNGHRRFLAAQLVKLAKVPVILDAGDRTPQEVCERQLATFARSDLNPMDRSDCLKRLLEQSGRTAAETALRVGIAPGTASKLLTLQLLSAADQARVRSGELGFVEGYRKAIGRSPSKPPSEVHVHDGPRTVARTSHRRPRPTRIKVRESVTLTVGSSCGATLDDIVADLGTLLWRLGTLQTQGKSLSEAVSALSARSSSDPPDAPAPVPS